MQISSLSHLTDGALRREMVDAVVAASDATARVVAHLAEFDARRLYAAEGYPSMRVFCVQELHLSEDAAFRRIRAARTARQFPGILSALAAGRLHLTAVVLLTPRLTSENADELIEAATHCSRAQIEQLLAERFPQPDLPTVVRCAAPGGEPQLAPAPVSTAAPQLAPAPVRNAPPRVAALAPERYALQLTMGKSLHDKLRHAQELLSHKLSRQQVAEVLELALDTLIASIGKRRYAATEKPRAQRKPARGRHIPAAVKRAVVKRDGGQCTFVAANGRRCEARGRLEFDHIEPVARGGRSAVDNLRLRCRAHNQYEAEQAFGAGFMQTKRERARVTADEQAAEAVPDQSAPASAAPANAAPANGASANTSRAPAPAAKPAATHQTDDLDLTPWLARLGFRKDEVRRAAAHCRNLPDATLEQRVRAALSYLRPPARVTGPRLASNEQAGAARSHTPAPAAN